MHNLFGTTDRARGVRAASKEPRFSLREWFSNYLKIDSTPQEFLIQISKLGTRTDSMVKKKISYLYPSSHSGRFNFSELKMAIFELF